MTSAELSQFFLIYRSYDTSSAFDLNFMNTEWRQGLTQIEAALLASDLTPSVFGKICQSVQADAKMSDYVAQNESNVQSWIAGDRISLDDLPYVMNAFKINGNEAVFKALE